MSSFRRSTCRSMYGCSLTVGTEVVLGSSVRARRPAHDRSLTKGASDSRLATALFTNVTSSHLSDTAFRDNAANARLSGSNASIRALGYSALKYQTLTPT